MNPEVWLVCLALNVYFEARSEPIEGQYAVAEVTIRRAKESGRSICEEVFQDKQFSWTMSSDKNIVKDKQAWLIAEAVSHYSYTTGKTDWSKGATHFHANYVTPQWAKSMCQTAKIGKHLFYKPCK